jgi:hypothetical protein
VCSLIGICAAQIDCPIEPIITIYWQYGTLQKGAQFIAYFYGMVLAGSNYRERQLYLGFKDAGLLMQKQRIRPQARHADVSVPAQKLTMQARH